ncbi:MAG: alpha-amylase [Candidatus Mcinerneyibacterium aminivorans]|uniref:Alpha-amylase n=1 Tax=Candidatus Mcinerneyibacterium aminivorans TaxID=2703815 RepID=A0A5D0MJT1_9BACT|nr:MAG: alpha-amylase [Candidatus Mcinerneyibacterium aminivorans]
MTENRSYFPSPEEWEDQIIYLLMVDRFSNGREKEVELYIPEKHFNEIENENIKIWETAGDRWVGGTLKGIISKLDYLKNLGITCLWLNPVFKQTAYNDNYHGYGIQNFLEIDPHIGTKNDLKELVEKAHEKGIYIILDIVINHSGDVFGYKEENPKYFGDRYEIEGFRNHEGLAVIPPAEKDDLNNSWPDGAVWPEELQNIEAYERKGEIQNWDSFPEYVEGDFSSFKTFNLGKDENDNFQFSETLKNLTQIYKYWIAFADIDGFRVDTIKHIPREATKYFVREIHEFARSIGKNNFYLIGEITGGLEFAIETKNKTGLNAALGINEIASQLENTAKGYISPSSYFNIFSNTDLLGEDAHLWFKDNVVTMFDDHDMVSLGENEKFRFCADEKTSKLVLNALFLNIFSLGIPCVYYGTEQGFDGHGNSDKYVRESMFGGDFGAFRTQNKHFFNQENPIYKSLSRMLKKRKDDATFRHGRQYLRKISEDGKQFGFVEKIGDDRIVSVISWSKILSGNEYIFAINTNIEDEISCFVMIDSELNSEGDVYETVFASQKDYLKNKSLVKVNDRMEKFLSIKVPPHGHVIYAKSHNKE